MAVGALIEKAGYNPDVDSASCSGLLALRSGLDSLWREYGASCDSCIVFLSFSDLTQRATVINAYGKHPDEVWSKLISQMSLLNAYSNPNLHLKLDLVTEHYSMTWAKLRDVLEVTKRNYFRFGLAVDEEFNRAFLEQELNANAMLYGGREEESASLNKMNFRHYCRKKYGVDTDLDFEDDGIVKVFVTQGVYTTNGESLLRIEGKGLEAGCRVMNRITVSALDEVIKSAATYLKGQLSSEGRFNYGWYPCFDREVHGYNTLRHASSTYALAEVYEVFPDEELLKAIKCSLDYLCRKHVKQPTHSRKDIAFLIDEGYEIKLGGCAVLLLAMTKYTEVSADTQYLSLMEKLAAGIASFQRKKNGRFKHVLNYPTLMLKDDFRVIYYDGEAAFALAYYARFSGNKSFLSVVEQAFDWFEMKNYQQHHDHWIAYACEIMYSLTADERYYKMAHANVDSYLDFITNRVTAFPTLLELMCATERLFTTREKSHPDTFEKIGRENIKKAMDARARKLMHAYFWPELAMYYQNPKKIMDSFFIRHHSFRVRIDDVEHFLSALIAYRKSLLNKF